MARTLLILTLLAGAGVGGIYAARWASAPVQAQPDPGAPSAPRGQSPPLGSPGNSGACGKPSAYLDAELVREGYGAIRQSVPIANSTQMRDYYRFFNPPVAVIQQAITDGWRVQFSEGCYYVTRDCP